MLAGSHDLFNIFLYFNNISFHLRLGFIYFCTKPKKMFVSGIFKVSGLLQVVSDY